MEPAETTSSWEGIEPNYWHCPNRKLRTCPEMKRFTGEEIADFPRTSFQSQQVDQAIGEAAFLCVALIHVCEE